MGEDEPEKIQFVAAEAAQGGVPEQRVILVGMNEISEGGVGMRGGGGREGRFELAQGESDLEEDIDTWVAGEGDHAADEFGGRVGIEEGFGEADGSGGDFWVRGIQGSEKSFFVEPSETFECPEGVQLRERMSGRGGELFEIGHDGKIGAFDEESLSGVTPPAVGVRQGLDELEGWGGCQAGLMRRGWVCGRGCGDGFVGDAIDTAEVQRFVEATVEVLLAEVRGQVIPVFDCAAVHIDDVEGAIGTVEQVDGAESFVSGCEELGLGVRIDGLEQAVGFDQKVAPDQVCGWLAEEDISVEFRWELMAAIDERGAGGGESGEGAVGPEGAG